MEDSQVGAPALPPALSAAARWPTGLKIFVILSIALLPLAMIAVFATLRTNQVADTEARARLRVAAAEASRSIAIELIGDMTALRAAVDELDDDADTMDTDDLTGCARVLGVFAQQATKGVRFVVLDRAGRPVCGRRFPGAEQVTRSNGESPIVARVVDGQGLMLGIAAKSRRIAAAAYFPATFLDRLGHPSGFVPDYAAALTHAEDRLVLRPLPARQPLERRETSRIPLGLGDLAFEMQVRSAPISSPLIIALLLPLLMWAAAASISWFVVDRLLVRPLRDLRASIATYAPGDAPDPAVLNALPAQEIRELGETFRAISRTVALHEAGLAEGLIRQTKLTREVHHRVKNNLQVISSLINFHARSARTPEASQAYASIQRRVDALAVVHRNHFAEMEENRGLGLRPVMGELASNIRATAPEGSRLGIVLDIDPYYVNQDVAVAIAFLVTETVELAFGCDPAAQVRISLKPGETDTRAVLRVSSRALTESDLLREGIEQRYGRVMEGLSRQLRSPLHHDPLAGAYEIAITVLGHD